MQRQNIILPAPNVDSTAPNVDSTAPNVDRTHEDRKFVCEKCGKSYTRNENLKSHATKCKGVSNTLQCPKCLVILASYSTKCRHLKTCNVVQMQTVPSSTTINHMHTTNNNTQIINNYYCPPGVRSLGKENLSYITPEFLEANARNVGQFGMTNLVEMIHMHPDHPENHNIWIGKGPHDKHDVYYVVRDQGVVRMTEERAMIEAMSISHDLMYHHAFDKRKKNQCNLSIDIYERQRIEAMYEGIMAKLNSLTCNAKNSHEYMKNRKAIKESLLAISRENKYPIAHPLTLPAARLANASEIQ